MRELVNHILAVADEHGLEITNLQLQKILYFSLIEAFRRRILTRAQLLEIYTQPFLVWRYGPVVEDLYEEYKIYGSSPILEYGTVSERLNGLNEFIDSQLRRRPFDLVNESHQHMHWINNQDAIVYGRSDIEYTLDDLLQEAS
ncbi:hypothetical protein ERX37_07720 [Macrococcus hajekii]|uniref:DUF4065 domain-containing protein n=1 Tax=Macrococcus hajekii TaxID=198482 RepID=A0A4R6BKA5_9STAP|nr:hypothetical protein [Macrococcus hajekii]TDM02080.1 hypothetical protein ERX37_07720 [Macrococcus hajekii]GGB09942.1 hypothetical protein GCM10007190_17490 [Macrococcus hajekii]